MALETRLAEIRKHIENNKKNNPLAAGGDITLLAASKGQPAAVIEQAIAYGITDFGENRVQEAQTKWPEIKKRHPHIRLHLIGPLQTNKLQAALTLFDVIQTLDRRKLVLSLASCVFSEKAGDPRPTTQSYYVQINTGKEPQKAGILPEDADAFIADCQARGLPIAGLMCIPPHDQPPAPHFALLRQIAQQHGINGLSMGMSDDYQEALRMGATCIRLGRALFGERPVSSQLSS